MTQIGVTHCELCGVPVRPVGGRLSRYCPDCNILPYRFKNRLRRCDDCGTTQPVRGWARPFTESVTIKLTKEGEEFEFETIALVCKDCFEDRCSHYALINWRLKRSA